MAVFATMETDCRQTLIFHINHFSIHLKLGDEGFGEVQTHCHPGEFPSITRFSVIVYVDHIANDVPNGADDSLTVVPRRKLGKADPSDDLADCVLPRLEGGGPSLD